MGFIMYAVYFALLVAAVSSAQKMKVSTAGSVYAMSNNLEANTVVAYSRSSQGKLTFMGEFPTGGRGGIFGLGTGSDPLVSQFSIILTSDRRFLLVANAGSNSVTVFRVLSNFSLRRISVTRVPGTAPVSIAAFGNTVYVASADVDGVLTSPLDSEGLISGFKLIGGKLIAIPRSVRRLDNRPSTVSFSPDGRFLAYCAFNAGAAALSSGSIASVSVFGVDRIGRLSSSPLGTGISTLPNNPEGRNLPGVIGIVVVQSAGVPYIVAAESRALLPDGTLSPPAQLQASSVSTWRIEDNGSLVPVSQDVLVGASVTSGELAACWLAFSGDGDNFWVANTGSSSLSSFSFKAGKVVLVNASETANPGSAFIDFCTSSDGRFLYQHEGNTGMVGAYKIEASGRGTGLTLINSAAGLPMGETQGAACI